MKLLDELEYPLRHVFLRYACFNLTLKLLTVVLQVLDFCFFRDHAELMDLQLENLLVKLKVLMKSCSMKLNWQLQLKKKKLMLLKLTLLRFLSDAFKPKFEFLLLVLCSTFAALLHDFSYVGFVFCIVPIILLLKFYILCEVYLVEVPPENIFLL